MTLKQEALELMGHGKQLESLTENIPGGVYQCKCDSGMTFLNISSSFLTLIGYSEEEIENRFHNHFSELIYPPDLINVQTEGDKQLVWGDTTELEFRIVRRDGRLLWILNQGKYAALEDGSHCFYCILMDITRRRAEQEELRLSLERHQIIMDQTTDIIFDWDIANDKLEFSSNWRKKFGYEPIGENLAWAVPMTENVHPDDLPELLELMADTVTGAHYGETEIRIRDVLGNYLWMRIRTTVQVDQQGRALKAVGVLIDIDADKKQRQRLLEQAQRDALTNLYNKSAIRELIEQKMKESDGLENQALLILDIDHFKQVNDTYGHLCGDSLLSDVAGVLRGHFHADDLVGRIGGDEFLIYLPKISGKHEMAEKSQSLLADLHALKPQKNAPPVSCSIGIALFPQKDIDYFSLYKCADIALYQMKDRGKNHFLFYDPAAGGDMLPRGASRSSISAIDSDMAGKSDAAGVELAQYAFKMLYDSVDVHMAVQRLLEIVGRAYDVSRVYIFESAEDGQKCSNTFEWCGAGVVSQIDNLQNIDYIAYPGEYLRNFDENHIFYCKDIRELSPDLYTVLAPQEICTLLQCAMMDDGVFKGYVGFDECRENRRWVREQVNALVMIANTLSVFLLKLRLKERLARIKTPENS